MSYKLNWGTTTFNLLGITFSVYLEELSSLNLTLEKSEKILFNWKAAKSSRKNHKIINQKHLFCQNLYTLSQHFHYL